jgi:hypothetical protein
MPSAKPAFPAQTYRMFEYQDKLPTLPVPDLQSSLKHFLVSVQPLLTADEKVEAERLVADMAQDATVADLQRQLEARAAESAALVAQSRNGNTPQVCVGRTFTRTLALYEQEASE